MEIIVETRMKQYNEFKTKTTQVILPDLNSLTQHIKWGNFKKSLLLGALNKNIQECYPCVSCWRREEETGTFISLWYDCNQLPH